jgi:chromosome segregation ATPase
LDQLRQTLNSSNTARQELTRRIEELRDENERLTEKASVEEELHTLMISLREAKAEIAAKDNEASNWRQKSLRLEEQCDQLQSDLSHKDATLQKAENELHSLRSNALDSDILSKLEAELHEAKRESEKNRQKLREALASRENSDAELVQSRKEISDIKIQIAEITTKFEESELKRQQLEQKRLDEVRRLRDDHRVEIDRMRREFLDEKERIAEKIVIAEEDVKKSHLNSEEIRRSVEESQKRLADALNCPSNFDLMLSTIKENQRRFTELQNQLEDGYSSRRAQESHLSEELNR